jgi:hypothetical protein
VESLPRARHELRIIMTRKENPGLKQDAMASFLSILFGINTLGKLVFVLLPEDKDLRILVLSDFDQSGLFSI